MFALKRLCNKKMITSREISEKTGIPLQTIDQYRSGRKEPSFSRGMKIADALQVDPHELLKEEE